MQNITKRFGEFIANDSINLQVEQGSIHAIVGENGAGKSTLMNILYGMYSPDEGKILLNGKAAEINSTHTAIANNIGMVHQHFMLVGTLNVIENIVLGAEQIKGPGFVDYKYSKSLLYDLAGGFNINIDFDAKVDTLPVGIQQKIEILKILYRKADILILDEPTAVLTPQETDELFAILRKLKSGGKTIIIITHKLREVIDISDNVTVLRHGKNVGERETAKTTPGELANLIVGHEIASESNPGGAIGDKSILSVNSISVTNDKKLLAVNNVSFEVKAGEIFSVAGVEGNGQAELVDAIAGLRRVNSGNIMINGNQMIAHIPADRHRDGIVMDFDVSENMILGRQRENNFGSVLMMNAKAIDEYSNELISKYDVRPGNSKAKISDLSGGNQQKAVVARELSKGADLIIVSHPTRGLDIKATEFVHHSILMEKEKGKSVLLISSDLTEILKLSDRIAVMYNGEFSAVLDAKKTNEREIGVHMTGAK